MRAGDPQPVSIKSSEGILLSSSKLVLRAITLTVSLLLMISLCGQWRSEAQLRQPTIADGFEMNLFATPDNVPEFAVSATSGPTAIAFDSRGRLFAATLSGKILILLDNNDDGVVDQVKQFASGLDNVLGIAFRADGDLYCTSNVPRGVGRIIRLQDLDKDDIAETKTTVLDNLPSQGDHQTARLRFGPDGLVYFGQGSATDAGTPIPGNPPEGPLNGTILTFDPDNPAINVFASGLRQPFGMVFHPETGDLFVTDAGSGEFCLANCPPEDLAPPEEVNWVVQGGNYGFPHCEGTPNATPDCAGVRAPAIQYPAHLTPTSLSAYTGPQAGEFRNQLLLTLYKNYHNLQNYGADLRRLTIQGDASTGITLHDEGFIVQLQPIDPFDGPLDSAIDPVTGDIYLVRFDPVAHRDLNEHHHFIYRIHRNGTDALPFIAAPSPNAVKVGSGSTTIALVGKHLKPGAIVFDVTDNLPLVTMGGSTIFDIAAVLPANLLTVERTIILELRNSDGTVSNQQTFKVTQGDTDAQSPQISSIFVYKKRRTKVVNPVIAGSKPKKLRLVVDGTDFDASAQVLSNGVALVLESQSPTELICRFTKEMIAVPGNLTIQVRNGNGKVSNTAQLTVSP
jgi:glucose/arabinose dehydrogenase